MSHGFETEPGIAPGMVEPRNAALAALARSMTWFNLQVLRLSMLALVLTSAVLTYSVVTRYFLKIATDWQDEASVFMLVGAMFMCTAYVQSQRGHVGIEALATILPAGVNRVRVLLVDIVSTLFCSFFAWKSWTLFYEAWSEGQTTSSSFAPPLWIPYAMMAAGMTLLAIQLFLQSATRVTGGEVRGDLK
ncbi:MAG: TRAP transporter small permease [Burkholderiaceae bacterium]|nr:TRAP transporter small permease [Burkholderiaceae bacterium]